MPTKTQLITLLREEFNRWEELTGGLSLEQVDVPLTPSTFSIKDTLAHLMAWQQRSIARLEAAVHNSTPQFPQWSADIDPNSDEDLERVNAWIYSTYHNQSWPDVYRAWRSGYLHFLELGEAIPEADLLDTKKYPWLEGYSLAQILQASYEHHHIEHLDQLQHWLQQHGNAR